MVVYGYAPRLSGTTPQWLLPLTAEQGRALRRSQFRSLLFIFERTILRTFKSRYTQFLLFWYSSLDPEFTDNFLGLLLNKALVEVDQTHVTRAAAASYVASFVSRAQFVDGDSARRVVGLLCAYLSRQLKVYAEAQGPTHTSQYTVFYAVAQAVFLIFCFRWRELQLEYGQEGPSDDVWVVCDGASIKKWTPELEVVQRVIISALNPLKVRFLIICVQYRINASVNHKSPAGLFRECCKIIRPGDPDYWFYVLLLHPRARSTKRIYFGNGFNFYIFSNRPVLQCQLEQ